MAIVPKDHTVVKDSNRGHDASSASVLHLGVGVEELPDLWAEFWALAAEAKAAWNLLCDELPGLSRPLAQFLGWLRERGIAFELVHEGTGRYDGEVHFETGYAMGRFMPPYPVGARA